MSVHLNQLFRHHIAQYQQTVQYSFRLYSIKLRQKETGCYFLQQNQNHDSIIHLLFCFATVTLTLKVADIQYIHNRSVNFKIDISKIISFIVASL